MPCRTFDAVDAVVVVGATETVVEAMRSTTEKLQSCSSYIVKSRLSYFMLFEMDVVDSVSYLLPEKHKRGAPL
jgi:hypothetical protein